MTPAIVERLGQLEVGGRLTPEAVVDDARDPESPLHERFEWSDENAAHAYRLQQARTLIRAVKVERETTTRTLAPKYVRDPSCTRGEQGYISTQRAKSSAELARSVVVAELARAESLVGRARLVAEELGMSAELEELLGRLVAFREAAAA